MAQTSYTKYEAQVVLTTYLFSYSTANLFRETTRLSLLAQETMFAEYRQKIASQFNNITIPTLSWLKSDCYTHAQIEAFKERIKLLVNNCVINVKCEAELIAKESFEKKKNAIEFNLLSSGEFQIRVANDIVGIEVGDYFMMNSVLYKTTAVDIANEILTCKMEAATFALTNKNELADIAIADNYALTKAGESDINHILPKDVSNELFQIEGDVSVGTFLDIPNLQDLLDIPSNLYPQDETPELKLAKYNKLIALSKEYNTKHQELKTNIFGDYAGVAHSILLECDIYYDSFDLGLTPIIRMLSNGDGENNVKNPDTLALEFSKKLADYKAKKASLNGNLSNAIFLLNTANSLELVQDIILNYEITATN